MKHNDMDRIKEVLAKRHACYVLITCDTPTADGSMEVEMTYEGDAALASYLLQGAQDMMNGQEQEDDCFEAFS